MLRLVLHKNCSTKWQKYVFLISETIGNSVLISCQNLVFKMSLKSATQMWLLKSNAVTQNNPQIYYCDMYMLRNDDRKILSLFSVVKSFHVSGNSKLCMCGKTLKLITGSSLKSELKWFRQHLLVLNGWVAGSEQSEPAVYTEPRL